MKLRVESVAIGIDDNITDNIIKKYINILLKSSCRYFPSGTTLICISLRKKKKDQIPDLKFHKTSVCEEEKLNDVPKPKYPQAY